MSSQNLHLSWSRAGFSALLLSGVLAADGAELTSAPKASAPKVAAASGEGEQALKKFKLAPGLKADLFAAEPLLANPVAFSIDEQGRFYVVETFRLHAGVGDIRSRRSWADPAMIQKYGAAAIEDMILNDELASKTVEEDIAILKKYSPTRAATLSGEPDRVRLIYPGPDGRAQRSTVFADGFDKIGDGLAAGVLARQGKVWFANIPNLWLLQDTRGGGVANVKKSLHHGYGVRVGFLGHDMHGLKFGPDGKLYYTIGDRGANVKTADGRTAYTPEAGAVFRCNPDGTELEIFATGLRNPQELAFDKYGNLWTGDNNSDAGDPARWVYLVEGGDSGWRAGYQYIEQPRPRGPWLAERLCYPFWDGQAAFIVPPIDTIGSGPSGLAYYPGAGLSDQYNDHFFLVDFRGGSGNSGVHSFAVKPKGAGFETTDKSQFIWSVLATDFDFGYDGSAYVLDWVEGWGLSGKGRIYRVTDPEKSKTSTVQEVTTLFREGFAGRSEKALVGLLTHADMRVRQEAQFALAAKGSKSIGALSAVAAKSDHQLARIHAIWGLGQIGAKSRSALPPLLPLLSDTDDEVRAQAVKVLGDARYPQAFKGLVKALQDSSARVRYFAGIGVGKARRKEAVQPLLTMLRENNNQDPFLRHAGVMGLLGCSDKSTLLGAAKDPSVAVRLAAVVVLRRQEDPKVAQFLNDAEPRVVLEAARAINDASIYASLAPLASLINKQIPDEPLGRRVINANFRLGTPATAMALAKYAAGRDANNNLRVEAMQCLSEWAKPSGRERLQGLWRPLPTRDPVPAARAIESVVGEILKTAPDAIRAEGARLIAQYSLTQFGPELRELLASKDARPATRVEALKALAAINDPKLVESLDLAAADASEALRKEASSLRVKFKPGDAAAQLVAVLETGSLGEQQNAFATLATLPGAEPDAVLGKWLDKLAAGTLKRELALDVLEAAKKRDSAPLKEKLAKYAAAKSKDDTLGAYREALYGGNAADGRKIFFERAEASCLRCHKVGGEGGDVGPDLTGIGTRQPRETILESIAYPNAQIAAGFESVLVEAKNGVTYAGILKSETDKELVINSPEDGLVKVSKANIKSRQKTLSGMPDGMAGILSPRDLRDLVEYLAGQK
ncbi:MAG: HEAT repeat domain-containing protein [Opitutaceae bacterium]|nr:HEAT repeat domain-containing protein [Verrucomicrobiales bacterium]